jgi:hypothetical protein
MEGIVLGARAVPVLVGLGALVETARPRRGAGDGGRFIPHLAGTPALYSQGVYSGPEEDKTGPSHHAAG